MIQQFFYCFFAIYCFCVLFSVPKSELIFCGLTGAVGWFVHLLLIESFTTIPSIFIAVLFIGMLARFLSNKRKMPLTIFIFSGIMPFVPGGGIYNAIYMIIMNDPNALKKALETIEIACTIAIGIVVVLSIPDKIFKTK